MAKFVSPLRLYHVVLIAIALSLGSAAMAKRDETVDRVAIEQLTVEYSYLLDHGRANELADLFTPDGVFDNPNIGLHAEGREAIGTYYAKRAADPRTTRHISTNLHIIFETPDRATGTRLITYYRGDGPGPIFPAEPGSVSEYSEIYQRGTDGKWRFAYRNNRHLFSGSTDTEK
ncbi:MAG: nuclear transport factor 2 family protein [Sphingobium sp.]